jgi:hypothetical protein
LKFFVINIIIYFEISNILFIINNNYIFKVMKNSLIPKHQHTWSPLVERNSSTYVARPVVIPSKATEQEKATWEQS